MSATATGLTLRLAITRDRAGSSSSLDLPLVDCEQSPGLHNADPILEDLARLEQLRLNVHQNLKLRPLGSPSPRSAHGRPEAMSPATPSVYYTPISEIAPSPFVASIWSTPQQSPFQPFPRSLHPRDLLDRITHSPRCPLLLDTRPLGAFMHSRIQGSINLSIPTLILKRCKKPGGGFRSIDALRPFITTDAARDSWDHLMAPGGPWDGNVVVFDDEMDERDSASAAATLLAVLPPIVDGHVSCMQGGIALARSVPEIAHFFTTGDADPPPLADSRPAKLSLRTDVAHAARPRQLANIDISTPSPDRSPPLTAAPIILDIPTLDVPQSPGGASVPRRRVPSLQRLNTEMLPRKISSEGSLPKLKLQTNTTKRKGPPPSLAPPPAAGTSNGALLRPPPASPSHLNLVQSTSNGFDWSSSSSNGSTSPRLYPRTPDVASHPSSPLHTARPLVTTPGTDSAEREDLPVFSISTILPNFLYLGPEITLPEQVAQLEALGVKRILNIAMECEDNLGLRLRERFDRYYHIPMRDTVEEDNITRGMQDVCTFLDDARLHSSPTYVHCKAGKSRSVTAVMAYLIHANHWTLARAYAFVLERRKGISPNIGFVSELMTFEERELGGKSTGVVAPGGDEGGGGAGNFGHLAAARRAAHVRESLPPAFVAQASEGLVPQLADLAALQGVGDPGEELEVKDASGRYRHQRRAPVDERTLQPMRRVSKAGLESVEW